MATSERWQNRLSLHVTSRQPDSTAVSTQTILDGTERQGLRQRFQKLRIPPPTPSLTSTKSDDGPEINANGSQPLADSHCVPITLLPQSLEGEPAGQNIPGTKLKYFDKAIPEELSNRFFDIKVLYTQPLIEALSHGKRNPGDISMKLKYLGLTERTAQFHIVVQCEKKVAKRVRKFFTQRHVEEELIPDFCILVLDKAPLRLATGEIIEVLPGKAPNETWCGTPIMMRRGTASAVATLGGIIMIETTQQHLYGMTASHPLQKLQESHSESLATRRDSGSDSNYGSEDSEGEWDSMTDPGRSESPIERADDSLDAKQHDSGFHEVLGTIICDTFSTQAKKNYDWAVIDLNPKQVLPNKVINTWQGEGSGIMPNAEAEVHVNQSSSQSGSLTKRVIVIKEGGPQLGKMSFNSSSVMISPGSAFVEAHDLSVDDGFSLCPGDSGSWVVDETTWTVYGHVVSTDAFGEAQVLPIHLTLESIRKQFNAVRVYIPTSNEISNLQMVLSDPSSNSKDHLEDELSDANVNGETSQNGFRSNSEGPPDSVAVGDNSVSRQIDTVAKFGQKLNQRTKKHSQPFAKIESAALNLHQTTQRQQSDVAQPDSLLHQSPQYMEGRVHDEWNKRYGTRIRLLGLEENRSFLDMIREHESDISEIPTFILPDPRSRRWERIASYIESFCYGASLTLDRSTPSDAGNAAFIDIQEPRAWVSDRNYVPDGLPPPARVYGRVLDSIELYTILQRKRFHDDACDDTVGHRRRIYINNPNGSSILALIRTAIVSQRDGFNELVANYVTETPTPKIALKLSDWWNGCFVISFTLPFFTIRTEDREDTRRSCNGKRPFRRRHSLSTLDINHASAQESTNRDQSPQQHQAFLHEAACAFMVTGKSERYWTAVFLDEDFYVDQPKLSIEDEEDVVVGSIDPIIVQAELNATAITASPRAYALASLAATLKGIVEHHTDIQDEFAASFSRHISDNRHTLAQKGSYKSIQQWINDFHDTLEQVMFGNLRLFRKVDEFLCQDVLISPEGLPQSTSWRGVQDEKHALNSLRSIMESRNRLREINNDFLQCIEEAKREKKNSHIDEQQTFSLQLQQFTVAALVLGILNLAAQLYSGRPERGDPSAWPGFLVVVMLNLTIGGFTLLVLFRTVVSASWVRFSVWLLDSSPYLQSAVELFWAFVGLQRSLVPGLVGPIISLLHCISWCWNHVNPRRLFEIINEVSGRLSIGPSQVPR